jgi:hypothetical protein
VTMLEVEVNSTVLLVASVEVGTTDELSLSKVEAGTADLDEVAWEVTDAGWVIVAEAEVTTVVGPSTDIDELEVSIEMEDGIVDAIVVEDSVDAVLETSEAVWVTGEETVVENSKLRGSVVSGSVDELRKEPISLYDDQAVNVYLRDDTCRSTSRQRCSYIRRDPCRRDFRSTRYARRCDQS